MPSATNLSNPHHMHGIWGHHACIYTPHLCYPNTKRQGATLLIIINPCKPYLSASATTPHPLGRRKAD
jgi:hypothetical protein